MNTKTKIALITCLGLIVPIVVSRRNEAPAPTGRLSKLAAQQSDYLIFIGVPLASPKEWASAKSAGGGMLEVPGHGTLRISDVRAFVVAYSSGQLLDAELRGLRMPGGLGGLAPSATADSDSLRVDDLASGRDYLQITHAPSTTHPQDRNYYATTLENISTERIRVQRFGGYRRIGQNWTLATVTRKFFSAAEFREWYSVGTSGWIEPGQAVTDPNNYGTPPALWAYYCESESGKQFVSGGVLEME
jgi:hypothetical protein